MRFFAPQGRHVAPMGVKFGMEEGTEGLLLHAKFHPHRCNVSPLRGENPQNRPLSKLNTGKFALRAMLPVIKLVFVAYDSYRRGQPFCIRWRCGRRDKKRPSGGDLTNLVSSAGLPLFILIFRFKFKSAQPWSVVELFLDRRPIPVVAKWLDELRCHLV